MTDEQRVRTMCGWIGVEIGRSRVRTPGKVGYGLYRVRGSEHIAGGRTAAAPVVGGMSVHYRLTGWTAYAVDLEQVERAVESAISRGIPARPGVMLMCGWVDGRGQRIEVPTRWTSAYRGSRTLGVGAEVGMARAPVGAGLVNAETTTACQMMALDWVRMMTYEQMDRWRTSRTSLNRTVRQRRREANAAFQAEHAPARAAGLEARHGAKLRRNAQRRD